LNRGRTEISPEDLPYLSAIQPCPLIQSGTGILPVTSPASTTEDVWPIAHPWEVVANRVDSDIVSERQSYPLNFRQLKEKDTRPNAPFADGYSTRYSEIINWQAHPINPMLYRYFGSHAIETLRDRRLLTSKLSGFNDPFEFLFSPKRQYSTAELATMAENRLTDPLFLERIRSKFPDISIDGARSLLTRPDTLNLIQQGMPAAADSILSLRSGIADDKLRVICFSAATDPFDEILMWSHYARSHKGWRLGFELPTRDRLFHIDPVDYRDERVEVCGTGVPDDPDFDSGIREALRTKCTTWKYEAEHRLTANPRFLPSDTLPTGETGYFIPFRAEHLSRVDFGLHSDDDTNSQILEIIRASFPATTVYRARLHETDFRLNYEIAHSPTA
jgi:hypothetical protein